MAPMRPASFGSCATAWPGSWATTCRWTSLPVPASAPSTGRFWPPPTISPTFKAADWSSCGARSKSKSSCPSRPRDLLRAFRLLVTKSDPPPPPPGNVSIRRPARNQRARALRVRGHSLAQYSAQSEPAPRAFSLDLGHPCCDRTHRRVRQQRRSGAGQVESKIPSCATGPSNIGPRHVLASAAIPLLFPAVKVAGEFYTDGGLRQNTPMSPAIRLGADKVLLDLTAPRGQSERGGGAEKRPRGGVSKAVLPARQGAQRASPGSHRLRRRAHAAHQLDPARRSRGVWPASSTKCSTASSSSCAARRCARCACCIFARP